MTALVLALGLGFVAGLRVFTPIAAVLLVRGSVWGILAAVAALAEYVIDVLPNCPSRTRPMGLAARAISGGLVGWTIAVLHGGPGPLGAIAGIIGAMIGAFGGHAARMVAIARIGPYPAGIAEDIIATGLAALLVTR